MLLTVHRTTQRAVNSRTQRAGNSTLMPDCPTLLHTSGHRETPASIHITSRCLLEEQEQQSEYTIKQSERHFRAARLIDNREKQKRCQFQPLQVKPDGVSGWPA